MIPPTRQRSSSSSRTIIFFLANVLRLCVQPPRGSPCPFLLPLRRPLRPSLSSPRQLPAALSPGAVQILLQMLPFPLSLRRQLVAPFPHEEPTHPRSRLVLPFLQKQMRVLSCYLFHCCSIFVVAPFRRKFRLKLFSGCLTLILSNPLL